MTLHLLWILPTVLSSAFWLALVFESAWRESRKSFISIADVGPVAHTLGMFVFGALLALGIWGAFG